MPGRFITLEGGEGVGKSTQIGRLRARLEARGLEVVTTREPGGSPRAERIRESLLRGDAKPFGPFAEALLFAAARSDHLETLIRPALARGAVVVCDRFADSTRAYQGVLGDVEPDLIRALERVVVAETRPDLTLVLDAPVETSAARAAARRAERGEALDRFEAEKGDFHEGLRRAFLEIAAAEPDRCVVIDATRTPDEVETAIWQAVAARLPEAAEEAGPAPAGAHG